MSSHYSSTYRFTSAGKESEERRLNQRLAIAEVAARRADQDMRDIQTRMKDNDRRVQKLNTELSELSSEQTQQKRQLYRIEGEINQLEIQQNMDRELIQCNLSLVEDLAQDMAVLESDTSKNSRQIQQIRLFSEILQRETELAHRRIAENETHIQNLEGGLQQIVDYLEDYRQWQVAEREARYHDIDVQRRLATQIGSDLEPTRVEFFGAYHEYLSAMAIYEQAEENYQVGNLETAISQYQNCQIILTKITRDIDERERLFEAKRSHTAALITQLESEIKLLEAQNINTWYEAEFSQVSNRYRRLTQSFENREYEQAGRPVEIRQALDILSNQASQIFSDIRQLENQLLETLTKHRQRRERLRDILRTLQRVWNRSFEFDISFLNEQDPKSTLKFQTKRVGLPNVTVYLDLNEVIQFTWTGYPGMQCTPDIEQFEQLMVSEENVQFEVVGPRRDLPSYPNPPFDDDGSTLVVDLPEMDRNPMSRIPQR